MKLKDIFLLSALFLSFTDMQAAEVQRIKLKNNTVLSGYVSKQHPGKDLVFQAEKSQVYLKGSCVKSITNRIVSIGNLSNEWIKWAEDNKAFQGTGANRTLKLCDIHTSKGEIISNVRVLEKGAIVKYLELGDRSYSLNWDTITSIIEDKRANTLLSGINRRYVLSSNVEYEGQFVEEIPGKTISVLNKDGVVDVFESAKVVKCIFSATNPNQDIIEQSALLDAVRLKSTNEVVKGVVIEKNFNPRLPQDDYLLIRTLNSEIRSIKLKDVDEYGKEENNRYNPINDIILPDGKIVINRKEVKKVSVKESNNFIILPSDSCDLKFKVEPAGTKIKVEMGSTKTALDQQIQVLKVNKYVVGKKKRQTTQYGFTFEDIVKSNIRPLSKETSINGTIKYEYSVPDTGLFVVYNLSNKTAIPFRIE